MITLQPGDKAPLFTGKDQNGQTVKLIGYKGKKVALFFYPQDMTPTCTIQACNLRDNFTQLQQHGIEIVGISPDPIESHKKFETRNQLPFTLIADPEKKIIDLYGVWGEKQLYGRKYLGLHRTTFIIDEKGKILKIFAKPKSKQHASEIINALQVG